ncbi:hypothetical protein G7068_15140 [Leucobacter viscericola]|uniref:SLH domain-containing protein n=1 Tax=Leucobacter viscericola TaxID=2714935 RepID=A0A6G7XIL9_9MICO|nr:leucine-rich repeat domain-containing protein [Leucobacter viscericola]QIK64393.1 hypothetical protein G7068_15140 [Leucobacter viscericola]
MTKQKPMLRRLVQVAAATLVGALVGVGGVASAASAAPDDVVTFPDVALENALNAVTNKPAGTPFTEKRLAAVTYLAISNRGITDLSGLENVPNLSNLQISQNQVSDLSPISGLKKLQTLTLDQSQVSDLSPIAGLSTLKTLRFSSTGVTDLTPIANLTNLENLSFYNDEITSLEPLSNLTKLRTLTASLNKISDLTPLSELGSLESAFLDQNEISDVAPLSNLSSIQNLSLSANQIENVAPLGQLNTLTSLLLDLNQISDVAPLAGLQNLTALYLSNNRITDLSSLENLPLSDVSSQAVTGPTLYVPENATSFKLANPLAPYVLAKGEKVNVESGATLSSGVAQWKLGATTPAELKLGVVSDNSAKGSYSAVTTYPVVPAKYTNANPVSAKVGAQYAADLTVTPGFVATNHSITSGSVPGLTLDKKTGKLSGKPTKAGTFKFSTASSDAAGNAVVGTWSITVAADSGNGNGNGNGNGGGSGTDKCSAPRPIPVFADTPLAHKFYKEIDWMECMKYSTGWRQPVGKPLYKPADNLERQAMAAFIYRMEAPKNYKAPKVSPFADVKPGDSFYKEIAWMYESKLSTGYRETGGKPTFRPHDSLSREAMAAFIYRLEAPKNYTAPKVSPMADMKPGMSFYKEISWMYSEKLSTGNKTATGKEYWPKDDLSRQAMAAFIYRLVLDYRK